MERQINFPVSDTGRIKEKIIHFFEQFGFVLLKTEEASLKFRKKSSLLEAWKKDPLNWGSYICVFFSGNNIVADFSVNTDAQMNTREEYAVWQVFITSFQRYLETGAMDNTGLERAISESRRSRSRYLAWAVAGALTGGFLSFLYAELTNKSSITGLLLIPLMAAFFLSWRIGQVKKKAAF